MNIQGWVRWTFRHPRWVGYQLAAAVRERLTPVPDSFPALSGVPRHSLEGGIAEIMGCSVVDVRAVLDEHAAETRAAAAHPLPANWAATPTLMAACYSVCRLRRPSLVIETGTAAGFSASAILQALDVNQHGTLVSLELPRLGTIDFSYVGAAVPAHVRDRWSVVLGPSLMSFPRVVHGNKRIDVFLHDSDHSYWNQKAEYEFALRHLNAGGVIISDDVRNPSFLEVAARYDLKPVLIDQPPKESPIGLLARPLAQGQ